MTRAWRGVACPHLQGWFGCADCVSAPAGKAYREAIDGLNGSWHLPLDPLNSSSLEPYCPGASLLTQGPAHPEEPLQSLWARP